MKEFSVTFLGTADASVNPFEPTACCLIRAADTTIMIDAGIGALRQLRRLGVKPSAIDILLMTHWHFDHFLGLPAVLQSKRGKPPLMVFGPRPSLPARIYTSGLLRAAHVYSGTVTEHFYKDCGGLRLEAVPTDHDVHSMGWVISEKGTPVPRRLVYSGDTRPVPEVLEAARGADLLIHEATFPDRPASATDSHHHSTPLQAARLAKEAGAGALVLTHIKRRNINPEALEDARSVFPELVAPARLDKILVEPVPPAERKAPFGWGRYSIVSSANS